MRKLVKTIENIPVQAVREYIRDVLTEIIKSFHQESQIWFQEVFSQVFLKFTFTAIFFIFCLDF